MKTKLLVFLVILATMFSGLPSDICYAKQALTSYIYARVESDNVSLYKTPSLSQTDNVLFDLPKSYFVLLITNFSTDFYKAQYRDVVGFVLKDSVEAVEETPVAPYLKDVTFRVFSSDGMHLMASPSISSMAICDVDITRDMDYYGTCYGDEMIDGRGNVWYYTKYGENFGYLYSGLCDRLSNIPVNNEQTTLKPNPFDNTNNDYLYSLIEMSLPMKILLIFLVSLPAFVIVILLFKPIRLKDKKKDKITKSKAKKDIIKEIQIE